MRHTRKIGVAPMGRSYGATGDLPMVAAAQGSQACHMDVVAARGGHRALRRGRASLPGQIYHVTTTTRDREPIFDLPEAAFPAAACFHAPGLLGDASLLWVLMPDHAHWLPRLGERDGLAGVVCRLKSASARSTNAALGRSGAVWARAFHDHALRCDEDLLALARYIVANPVRAGLVRRVGDYPFWNAIWL
jgi:REP element-mobilizing transposase RayT